MNMFRKKKVKRNLVNMEYCFYHRKTELQHIIEKPISTDFKLLHAFQN